MVAEVIQVVERRRRWSTEFKMKVLTEALQPGASMAAVADRHGISRGLLYTWLRLARGGRIPGITVDAATASSVFAPVRVISEPVICSVPDIAARQGSPARRRTSVVEITLTNGRIVKVDEGIEAETLARIVAALDSTSS